MAVLNSSELIQTTLASFDPKCKDFAFHRTFPVAIYIDAGERSLQMGRSLDQHIRAVLSDSFEIHEFVEASGSFCILNICSSRVALDEPSLHEKIRSLIGELNFGVFQNTGQIAGSAATAVVAIGTVALIWHGAHPDLPIIGNFVIPSSVWVPLLITKEARDFIKEVTSIFVTSKAAKRALKQARRAGQVASASLFESAPRLSLKARSEDVTSDSERIRELEKVLTRVQRELRDLKKKQNVPTE
jgi:hypothetical protein